MWEAVRQVRMTGKLTLLGIWETMLPCTKTVTVKGNLLMELTFYQQHNMNFVYFNFLHV